MCLAQTLACDARSRGAMRVRRIAVIRPIVRRGVRRNLSVRPAHPSDVRRGHLHSCLQSRLVCMRGTVPITSRVRGRASLHSRRSWRVLICMIRFLNSTGPASPHVFPIGRCGVCNVSFAVGHACDTVVKQHLHHLSYRATNATVYHTRTVIA